MRVWLILACLAAAQSTAPRPAPPIETKHLTLSLSSGAVTAGKVPLYVDVTPQEKMHVYAPGQKGYIAIELTLDADAPVKAAGKTKYPPAKKLLMPALNETQLVYSTPFRITQDVVLRPGTPAGPIAITGTLRYQACDDNICYKPTTLALRWAFSNP